MHYSLPSTCTHSTAQSAGAHPTHIMCPHHGLLVGRESRPATVRPPHGAHTPTASRVSWTQHCHQAWSHRDCVGGGPLPLPSWTMLPQPFHFSPKWCTTWPANQAVLHTIGAALGEPCARTAIEGLPQCVGCAPGAACTAPAQQNGQHGCRHCSRKHMHLMRGNGCRYGRGCSCNGCNGCGCGHGCLWEGYKWCGCSCGWSCKGCRCQGGWSCKGCIGCRCQGSWSCKGCIGCRCQGGWSCKGCIGCRCQGSWSRKGCIGCRCQRGWSRKGCKEFGHRDGCSCKNAPFRRSSAQVQAPIVHINPPNPTGLLALCQAGAHMYCLRLSHPSCFSQRAELWWSCVQLPLWPLNLWGCAVTEIAQGAATGDSA